MAGIPLHITPLSYIRGSGSQYITTGIYLRSTDVVKSRWRFENSAGCVYGCFSGSSANDNFCLYAGSASTNAYIRYNGQVVRDFKAANGTIYNIEYGPDGFTAGSTSVTFTAATFTCSAPMYIFMLPNSSSPKVTARCYGLTVYRDGEQLCNFIPARNELTGEVGMWESVGGVFYENAGDDAFTAGPDVNVSVKTLLLKRRRALLGAAKAREWYITDGLVCHFDGINKGNNPAQWQDLVGYSYFPFSENVTSEPNAVVTDGIAGVMGVNPIQVSAIDGTIEVCAQMLAMRGGDFVFNAAMASASLNKNCPLSFIVFNTGIQFSYIRVLSRNTYGFNDLPTIVAQPFSASLSDANGYLNGAPATSGSQSGWNNTNIVLGSKGRTNYPANARIFSIRIYNRQLTYAEMQHNLAVDNARFNLGLTL